MYTYGITKFTKELTHFATPVKLTFKILTVYLHDCYIEIMLSSGKYLCYGLILFHCLTWIYNPLVFLTGVYGDSLTVLQAPEFVSFQKGDWPVSGEKIPDLVALTMGFSVQEVRCG